MFWRNACFTGVGEITSRCRKIPYMVLLGSESQDEYSLKMLTSWDASR